MNCLRREFRQIFAVARIGGDPFLPGLHGADRGHAAFLGGADELAVVVFGQAPGGKSAAGDAQQQQPAHGLRIVQSRTGSRCARRPRSR